MKRKTKLQKVSIIILNFNGYQITRECLMSLARIKYRNLEIIVVDNGSNDGSSEKLSKQFPRIRIIRNKQNKGYAEGNNIGYRAASGDLILFLNNDTLVDGNFLQPLIDKLNSSFEIGAVQPKIMNFPQVEVVDSVGSFFTASGFLYHYAHNKKANNKVKKTEDIFSMKGACMLFKKEVLKKVGTFDNDYFAYFEETDLCQRVLLNGYRLVYVPNSIIYHKGGETSKKIGGSIINYHSYKNRIYTYLKNFEVSTIFKVVPLHLLFCLVALLLYTITLRFRMAYSIFKAILWNIFHLPKLLLDRKAVNKLRKVRDKDYLPRVTRKVRLSYYYHLFTTALAGYKD